MLHLYSSNLIIYMYQSIKYHNKKTRVVYSVIEQF